MAGGDEFEALRAFSARVGADPLLVQGAGGNTSIKADGVMWIKASGTWLMNAVRDDIFVPVRLDPLREALRRSDPASESCVDFVVAEENPHGLRPSIETSVHAIFPQRIVVHVHCVATIAVAVREDARTLCAERLAGLDWVHVPYAKPGLTLSRLLRNALGPRTNVAVLGNHGLVVAGDSVAAVSELLGNVCRRLSGAIRPSPAHDLSALERFASGSRYRPAADTAIHPVGCDPVSLSHALRGSLYPDHVIFLGPGVVTTRSGESAAQAAARAVSTGLPEPVLVLVPGAGALTRIDASPGALAMARCLADVTARIPAEAHVNALTDSENAELLDWDAEKYRQALNAGVA